MISATLKTYRQSPRKVRLATYIIKGKSFLMALSQLKFLSKRASKRKWGQPPLFEEMGTATIVWTFVCSNNILSPIFLRTTGRLQR